MNIDGTWYNELGSSMTLSTNGKNITGMYQTAVGNASGQYDLVGQIDTNIGSSTAIGFVVMWNNSLDSRDCVTTWSGQCQVINGEDIIVTTWLLTGETNPGDNWASTLVNKDTFTRTRPTEEAIKINLDRGIKHSHPV